MFKFCYYILGVLNGEVRLNFKLKHCFFSKIAKFLNLLKIMCYFHFQFHHTRLAVILKTWFNVAPKNTFFFTGKWELFTHFLVTVQRFVRYRLQYRSLQCCGSGSGAFLSSGSELGTFQAMLMLELF
jgi:hypothetical protein